MGERPDEPNDDELRQWRDAALQTANSVLVLQRREREALRAKLQDIEDKFRQLAEQSGEGFWFVELSPERFVYVSPAVERIFGQPAQRFYDDRALWIAAVHPDDRVRVVEAWDRCVGSLAPRLSEEYRVISADGSVRWLLDSGTPFRDAAGAVTRMSGMIQDVSDRRELEGQLRQAQKMEMVGQLAGGIAHDFNNLLTVITGVSDLALATLSASHPLRRDLEEIFRAGQSGTMLTRQLLAFSRKQILQPRVLSLNAVVTDVTGILGRLVRENIDLIFALGDDEVNVNADAGQIEQVILNLVVNARDAMPDGGTISVVTRNVHLDERFARTHAVALDPGPYVLLTIADTGSGMDETTMARMFEPFFTTKSAGQGTGLGLSTAYGIVKQSNGFIVATSKLGHGTSVNVYLPRVAAGTVGPAPPVAPAPGGTEIILLVDDDDGFRRLARRILEGAGYQVLDAADGQKALALLERYEGPVDLLLTDVVMPGMNGRSLARLVSSVRSGIRILYTSGHIDGAIVQEAALDEQIAFVPKPFTPAMLVRKVRDVLDADR